LPRRLRSLGLVDVAAEVRFSLAGPAQGQLQRTLIQRARERLTASEIVSAEEVEQHLADIDGGRLDLAAFPGRIRLGAKASLTRGGEPVQPTS
jgi:hypothetical protein